MNALDNSRIGIAHKHSSIAQGAYEAALKYSQRETFGVPIGRHQLITGYLADMATRIEAARLLVYKASWAKEEHTRMEAQDTQRKRAWLSCLLRYCDVGFERAVQILGGYGFTKEFPVERFFRDAKITQIYEGTQEVQKLVIARALK